MPLGPANCVPILIDHPLRIRHGQHVRQTDGDHCIVGIPAMGVGPLNPLPVVMLGADAGIVSTLIRAPPIACRLGS